jgi:hypothetical protein
MGDGSGAKAAGISLEVRQRLAKFDAVEPLNKSGDYKLDAETFKWQAAEMLIEAGAGLLLHAQVCDPVMEDGRVVGVFTESKTGRQAIRAAVVIDCTADADVAFRAGCACDNETHDVTLKVTVDGVDRDAVKAFKEHLPERFAEVVAEAKRLNGGVMPDQVRHEKHIDVADAAALSCCETRLRRDCFRALHYLRENLPGWEQARVSETLPQLGVRQGRRIHGEYTITNDDLVSSRHFPDSIARLGACLLGYALYDPPGLDYDIPYRCLVPRNVDGLLVAGRCLSADYLAENSLRLIVPCFATGEAAGTAAAVAVRRGVEPRDVAIDELRNALAEVGVYLGPSQKGSAGPAESA